VQAYIYRISQWDEAWGGQTMSYLLERLGERAEGEHIAWQLWHADL